MEGVQFPVPEVPEDDVPQEGVLDEELLEDEVPEDKVAEDEVVTITISPTQHQQLLGMFGENYPLVMAAQTHIETSH